MAVEAIDRVCRQLIRRGSCRVVSGCFVDPCTTITLTYTPATVAQVSVDHWLADVLHELGG